MITGSLTRRLLLTVVLAALTGGAIWTLLLAAHSTTRVERLSSFVAQAFAANAAEIVKSHGEELLTVLRSIQRQSVSTSDGFSPDNIALAGRMQHPDAPLHIALYTPTGQILRSIEDRPASGSATNVATACGAISSLGIACRAV